MGYANNPHNFLKCTQIKDEIQQAFTSDNITPKQYTLIISFIAAKIIYGNSQRPGVAQNMNIEEYLRKVQESIELVLYITRHHQPVGLQNLL